GARANVKFREGHGRILRLNRSIYPPHRKRPGIAPRPRTVLKTAWNLDRVIDVAGDFETNVASRSRADVLDRDRRSLDGVQRARLVRRTVEQAVVLACCGSDI